MEGNFHAPSNQQRVRLRSGEKCERALSPRMTSSFSSRIPTFFHSSDADPRRGHEPRSCAYTTITTKTCCPASTIVKCETQRKPRIPEQAETARIRLDLTVNPEKIALEVERTIGKTDHDTTQRHIRTPEPIPFHLQSGMVAGTFPTNVAKSAQRIKTPPPGVCSNTIIAADACSHYSALPLLPQYPYHNPIMAAKMYCLSLTTHDAVCRRGAHHPEIRSISQSRKGADRSRLEPKLGSVSQIRLSQVFHY